MESVIRAAIIYLFLLVLFRATGKRTLAQITTFDFVLLLIIGEATQQGLLGEDFSITNALVIISTLVMLDIGLTKLKLRVPRLKGLLEGKPLVIVEAGRPLADRLAASRVDEDEVLAAARESRGIERLEEVERAVLENDGSISIIPRTPVTGHGKPQ